MSYLQYPNQPYPPQPGQQYPPQPQYPQQPQYQPPPAPPRPPAGIDDFYGQPAITGKALSFDRKPIGTRYIGAVVRNLTNADVIEQTDPATGVVAQWRDGRPKLTLVIPLQMQPTPEFPDGRASWYCKANERAELDRALEEAGLPHGSVPEQGGILDITYTRDVPTRAGLNARKEKHIIYTPPLPAAATSQPATPVEQQPAAIPVEPAGVQQPAATVPQAANVMQPAAPADLTPEQQALLARLKGQ